MYEETTNGRMRIRSRKLRLVSMTVFTNTLTRQHISVACRIKENTFCWIFHTVGCATWICFTAWTFPGLLRKCSRAPLEVSADTRHALHPFPRWRHKRPLHKYAIFVPGGSLPNFVQNHRWTGLADCIFLNRNANCISLEFCKPPLSWPD